MDTPESNENMELDSHNEWQEDEEEEDVEKEDNDEEDEE